MGTEIFLVGIFFSLYLLWVGWVYRGLKKIPSSPPPAVQEPLPFSIIIAAHNEEQHIGALLEGLAHQQYPRERFEVIVAADRCDDQTEDIVRTFQSKLPHLQLVSINNHPPSIPPKKYALQKAIEKARFNHLLFLDADVTVHQNHLQVFNSYFQTGSSAVVSVVKFPPPQSFFQKFLLYEKLISWCIAAAGVGNRRPVLAYGGNWGYTRDAFDAVKGFTELNSSLSGDDDLLVQRMGEKKLPLQFCLNEQGWVFTEPPNSLSEFIRQRRRHFSAGKHYSRTIQLGYLIYHSLNLFFWAGWVFYPSIAFALILKILVDTFILRKGMKMFREKFHPGEALTFNFVYFLYNTIIGPAGHIGKVKW
ncbi:MAG: glycosyltransferase [Calditrichaeota bacterium]|nr:MAG: glycosyltransferase [Calditrichota bacterium]